MAMTDDCRTYITCKTGKTLSTLRCPLGLRYNGRQCAPAAQTPCLSDCAHRSNGYYADTTSGCQSYFYCLEGELKEHKICPEGTLFNGYMCVPTQLFMCPMSHPKVQEKRSSKCVSQQDGFHTVYASGCRDYYFCSEGRVVLEGSCAINQLWNGKTCIEQEKLLCKGPEPWPGCVGTVAGLYQDYGTNCHQYYYCENGNRTQLECPKGDVFDGRICVPEDMYKCPKQEPDVCYQKPDGYYHDINSSCRSYYYCSNGHKITYVCPSSYVFDGKECVDKNTYKCPYVSKDCISQSNGYHYDKISECRKYFYCLDGDKITTLTCSENKIFDGRRCVESSDFQCPNTSQENICQSRPDGLFPHVGSKCRHYIRCKDQKQMSVSTCPNGKVFDGSECVEDWEKNNCDSVADDTTSFPSSDCTNMLNGFYQNHSSGCHSYFYCIDGMKTSLTCPGNEVFNGQVCVSSRSYTCPPVTTVKNIHYSTNNSNLTTGHIVQNKTLPLFPPT